MLFPRFVSKLRLHVPYFVRHQQYQAMAKEGPRPLVICGPSGSGKSTLLKQLMLEYPDTFGFSVSHTTRKPRDGEQHGVHYYYVDKAEMEAAIKNNEFLETATFSGNMYGTSLRAVQQVQGNGKVCVLDIEIEGVKQIKRSPLNAIFMFIEPPSVEELERRLRNRKTETEDSLRKRLDTAKRELEFGATPGNFDIIVHNANVRQAYEEMRNFIVQGLEAQRAAGVECNLNRNPEFKLDV